MNTGVKRIFFAQAIRALAYGFGSVLLGVSLDARGWSSIEVGLVLTSVRRRCRDHVDRQLVLSVTGSASADSMPGCM